MGKSMSAHRAMHRDIAMLLLGGPLFTLVLLPSLVPMPYVAVFSGDPLRPYPAAERATPRSRLGDLGPLVLL